MKQLKITITFAVIALLSVSVAQAGPNDLYMYTCTSGSETGFTETGITTEEQLDIAAAECSYNGGHFSYELISFL